MLDTAFDIISPPNFNPGQKPRGKDYLKQAKALLDLGLNLNRENHWGYTPLQQAVCNNQRELFTLLLSKGADPHVKSGNEDEFLAIAKKYNGNDLQLFNLIILGKDENTPEEISPGCCNLQ